MGTINSSHATGNVTGADHANIGGLAGYSGASISDSHATGNVSDSGGGNSNVGGLIGQSTASVSNSYATGSVSGGDDGDVVSNVGGLVGNNGGAISNNSYATGSVSGGQSAQVGGLAGYSNAPISDSHATGAVSVGSANDNQPSYVGGLVGYADAGATITGSYATGSVSGGSGDFGNNAAGGLVGTNFASITTSFATGAVTCTTSCDAGGLSGQAAGSISVSYAMGSVNDNGGNVGGLVGTTTASLIDTYARGAVTNTSGNTGGLVGYSNSVVATSYGSGLVTGPLGTTGGLIGQNDGATITYTYFDNHINSSLPGAGLGSTTGISGESTLTLQSGTMPTGFNTNNTVWLAPAGVYPYFSWQGPIVPVQGNALNGSYALGGAGVGLVWEGSVIANTITQSGGYYSFGVPHNMTVGGVLTFLTSGGVANAFTDGASIQGFGGMELYVGNIYVINGAIGTLSSLTNSLGTAIGSLTGSNFLYTVSSGLLNLNSGVGLLLASYPSFTFDRPLTTSGSILFETLQNATIANASPISAGSGDRITIAVGLANPAGTFTNDDGANALTASGGGEWLVYSHNPANDTADGLTPAFIQYNAGLLSTPGYSGDGLLYTIAPVITPSLTGTVGKTYDGTSAAALTSGNFAMSGAINGDTVTLTTPTTGTFAGPNVGTGIAVTAPGVAIASAINGSIPVYGYQLATPPATGNVGVINPATLTYIANPASTTYGAGNPAFSGTVTGFVNGETIASATTGAAAFTSSATATSNVGNYAINGSGLSANNGNYIFTQADGNSSALTINPSTLIYTANPVSITYGFSNPVFSGSVTGFVNGETLATATTGTAAFTSSATALSNVGNYTINGSGLAANNGNYIFTQGDGNSSALTINPATHNYTAKPVSVAYGLNNPVFSGSDSGFVNGQTLASATTGTAVFSSAAGAASPIGSYAIDGAGLTANNGNYVFTQAASNANALTVAAPLVPTPTPTPTPTPIPTPASIVLTFVIGNTTGLQNSKPTFTATYTGAPINGLDIASILSGLTFTLTPSLSGPGAYTITATGNAPAGYTLNIAPATLTIVASSSAILPTQAPLITPVVPQLLPNPGGNGATSLLQPLNSVGLFQVDVTAVSGSSQASFIGFVNQPTPLAQSQFFGTNDKKDTYSAGAKP